jgi:hypothetical protein
MNNQKTIVAVMAAAFVLAIGVLAVVHQQDAMAKINRGGDTSCTNNGGNDPGGQQPTCTGGGLTQNTAPNTNRGGNEPPGQQEDCNGC